MEEEDKINWEMKTKSLDTSGKSLEWENNKEHWRKAGNSQENKNELK